MGSLEVVRIASRICKKQSGRVRPELLSCFFHLPLSKDILEAQVEDKKKKKRKRDLSEAGLKGLKNDLKEADAELSVETRKKVQTAMITEVFTTYFRVLKSKQASSSLPVILKGLARFCHLINLEHY